jgi:hypothetical protein
MTDRLLERQVELLAYLTSGAAIFGNDAGAGDQALRGMDRSLLRLEARFSHQKRMEKIAVVFPRTLAVLGAAADTVIREFAAACPPQDISRIENARQFHDFLCGGCRQPLAPPFLRDVAACELAVLKARVSVEEEETPLAPANQGEAGIRRRRELILLRCSYDIRPVFEGTDQVAPIERDTPLAIGMFAGASDPQVIELAPAVFDLVAILDGWTDPAALGATPELQALVRDLADHGVLEVRG